MKRAILNAVIASSIISVLMLYTPARAQWTEPMRIGAPGGVLYTQMIAYGNTIHVVYSNNDGGWKIGYVRSTDGGDTWSDQYVISDTANTTLTYTPQIIKHDNALMILWLCKFIHSYYYNAGYSISLNGGHDWSEPEYVLDQNWFYPFLISATAVGPIINIETSGGSGNATLFYNIRSTDFGQSWSDPLQIFSAMTATGVNQASCGDLVVYTWSGFFNSGDDVEAYIIRSTDAGITWGENIMISDDDGRISQSPAVCFDENGNLACTWWDFKYSPYQTTGDILLRQSSDGGNTWETENRVTVEHKARLSRPFWSNDSIYVVWQDYRFGNSTIYYAARPDSDYVWSDRQRLEDDPEDSRWPAIAVSNGRVYVVWSDERCDPDTDICGGVYFTRFDNQSGIQGDGEAILPEYLTMNVYPNPFNASTNIRFILSEQSHVSIYIYNILGQEVEKLFEGMKQPGSHALNWDAGRYPSGVYFARVAEGDITKSIKMVLLK